MSNIIDYKNPSQSVLHVWTYPIMQEKITFNNKSSKCSHVSGLF